MRPSVCVSLSLPSLVIRRPRYHGNGCRYVENVDEVYRRGCVQNLVGLIFFLLSSFRLSLSRIFRLRSFSLSVSASTSESSHLGMFACAGVSVYDSTSVYVCAS